MFGWVRNLFGGRATAKLAETRARLAGVQAALFHEQFKKIRARYDNSLTTPDNVRNWQLADYMSAKSSNDYRTRRMLRMRSRYEVGNNPFLFGIAVSNADDLIDTGPTLQVLTDSAAYNREVEQLWNEWYDEVSLAEKLKTQKLAKTVDGEGFLVGKTVPDLESPVKLYPLDVEADQFTTPAPTNLEELWVDGLVLHPVTERPTAYTLLRHHPGDYYFPDFNPMAVERVSARVVWHWFPKWRPGTVRGLPVFTPSLDLFAELRSFRRAVLQAAQIAADYAAVLETGATGPPGGLDNDPDGAEPYEHIPIDRGTMTTLPAGFKLSQFRSENPSTTYQMFQECCLGEACRPLGYPLNLALGTSQRFNFSSAKLDHINYRNGLKVERRDCERVTLNPMFREWYAEAVLSGALPAYDGLRVPPHEWHWPGFPLLDPSDAKVDLDQIAGGSKTWKDYWAGRGRDWKDMMRQQAVEKEEMERLNLVFGEPLQQTVSQPPDADEPPARGGRRFTRVGSEHQ